MDSLLENAILSVFDRIDKIAFFEQHPNLAICITCDRNLIVWANNSFCNLFEYSQEELFNQPLDLLRGDSSRLLDFHIHKILEEGKTSNIKLRVVTKSGRRFSVSGQVSPLPSDTKYFFYSFSLYSERVRLLLQSMQNCYKLLTGNPCVLFITVESDRPYRIQLITQNSFLEIGQDFEAIQNQSIFKFVILGDAKKLKKKFIKLIENDSEELDLLEIRWKATENNSSKLLKVMVQFDRSEHCFYLIAAPVYNTVLQESQQTIDELKEVTHLPEKAIAKIQILEQNLKHQKDIDDLYRDQIEMLFQKINQSTNQIETLSSQVSIIYSDVVEVIQDYKQKKKNKQAREELLKERIVMAITSPAFLPLASLTLLLIIQMIVVIFPSAPLASLEQKIIVFLLQFFE